MDLVLATCDPLPEPDPDAAPLTEAFARAGIPTRWVAWDAGPEHFAGASLVVLRSTWDYIHRLDAFLAWADSLGNRLVNPPAMVRWNAHKGYLAELERAGLPIVPTAFVARGSSADLPEILRDRGWSDAVVKPAVSAGSFRTHRVRLADLVESPDWFAELVQARDTMVQPYVASVDSHGERSFIFLGGEITHSVRKTPRFAGDHEAISGPARPFGEDDRAFALRAVSLAETLSGARALYGRVDVAQDDAGRWMLMELELIEPSLFFDRSPAALARFVELVKTRLFQLDRGEP